MLAQIILNSIPESRGLETIDKTDLRTPGRLSRNPETSDNP